MKTNDTKFKTILVKGIFNFIGNPNSNFKGPIKKGFRPIVWLDNVNKGATSCSFISEVEIQLGASKEIEIAILNELQLNEKIVEGTLLNVGSTIHKIGEFIVTEHLGVWKNGKIP